MVRSFVTLYFFVIYYKTTLWETRILAVILEKYGIVNWSSNSLIYNNYKALKINLMYPDREVLGGLVVSKFGI